MAKPLVKGSYGNSMKYGTENIHKSVGISQTQGNSSRLEKSLHKFSSSKLPGTKSLRRMKWRFSMEFRKSDVSSKSSPENSAISFEAPWSSSAARRAGFGSTTPEFVEEEHPHVVGKIPSWLSGILIRNGPGSYENGTKTGMQHMFDGYGALLKVEIDGKNNKMIASRRFLNSQAWSGFKRTGKMQYREFGTPVPCNTTWDRAIDIFKTIGGAFTDNASVHIIPRGSNWWALTESITGAFAIDPSNLFTTAQIEYDDQLGGPSDLTTAHPSVLENGDMVNIISTPGIGFRLYRLPQSSSLQFEEEGTYLSHDCRPRKAKIQRELIAKIPHRHFIAPSWIHDFPSTQNYVILFETPIYFNLASLLFGSETSYLFMDWKPEEGTLVHVVRLSDGAVASCRAPPFFAFHYANAWEENLDGSEVIDSNSNRKNSKQAVLDKQSKKLIYIDAAIYSDPTIVNHLKLENMRITPEAAAELPPSQIRRLCLEISEDFSSVAVISNTRQAAERGAAPYSLETVWKKLANDVTVFGNYADFPSVNPSKKGYKHRYVWGICAVRPAMQAQGIAKWDTETGETKVWSEVAGIVNEPVFVPRPGATAEDDGAIVVTVIQPNGKTAVVIIDGQTHQELARAVLLNGTLTVGFHGSFVPSWQ